MPNSGTTELATTDQSMVGCLSGPLQYLRRQRSRAHIRRAPISRPESPNERRDSRNRQTSDSRTTKRGSESRGFAFFRGSMGQRSKTTLETNSNIRTDATNSRRAKSVSFRDTSTRGGSVSIEKSTTKTREKRKHVRASEVEGSKVDATHLMELLRQYLEEEDDEEQRIMVLNRTRRKYPERTHELNMLDVSTRAAQRINGKVQLIPCRSLCTQREAIRHYFVAITSDMYYKYFITIDSDDTMTLSLAKPTDRVHAFKLEDIDDQYSILVRSDGKALELGSRQADNISPQLISRKNAMVNEDAQLSKLDIKKCLVSDVEFNIQQRGRLAKRSTGTKDYRVRLVVDAQNHTPYWKTLIS